ncbi:YbaN family protein [Variovorax rhizosphaerae]|uniref:YbaN family protein n=1 Tax=Variovorax rhizosphaerae TaxID=1836200 RepID=A0ABU8WZL9_9BURK
MARDNPANAGLAAGGAQCGGQAMTERVSGEARLQPARPEHGQASPLPADPVLRRIVATLLWRTLAVLCLLLGLLGVFLPVMPTVPFVLVAAWAAGRGWPALESWLVGHPRYGVHVRQWREGGFVPRRAKWAASIGMMGSAILLQFLPVPLAARIAVPLCMALVAAWLWSRPEPLAAVGHEPLARR